MVTTGRSERTGRTVVVGAVLAVLTVAVWLAVLPLRWTLEPTGDAQTYTSAVPTSRFVIVAVVLVALAIASGALGHPLLPLAAVATPAFLLWCIQAATAESIGANMWIVGAVFLLPVAYGGALLAGLLGRGLRRLTGR